MKTTTYFVTPQSGTTTKKREYQQGVGGERKPKKLKKILTFYGEGGIHDLLLSYPNLKEKKRGLRSQHA